MEKYIVTLSSTMAYLRGYTHLEIWADNKYQMLQIAKEKYNITEDDIYTFYTTSL